VNYAPEIDKELFPMNPKPAFFQQLFLPLYLILVPLLSFAIALFVPLPVEAIALLMLLVPSVIAILLTALAEGGKSLAELLKKLFQWRIHLKWYAVAVLLPVGIILAAGVLGVILGWMPTLQIRIPTPSQLIFNFILVVLIAVLEELGWRGYALPRLLAHRSPLSSAVLIGITWGIVHIGLRLAAGRPWLPTFLAPLALSVIFTWLFVHTQGSLAMAILFHFVFNYSPQFVLSELPTVQVVWAQAIAGFALAFILILLFGVNLQRGSAKR